MSHIQKAIIKYKIWGFIGILMPASNELLATSSSSTLLDQFYYIWLISCHK
jgi:hypothetical protein